VPFVVSALATPGPGSAELPNGASTPSPWTIQGEVYQIRNNQPVTDFFGELTKGLKPGDKAIFTVALTNNFSRPVEFFMRTAPVTHDPSDSLDGLVSDDLNAPGASFEDKKTLPNDDLLDQVWLNISHPFMPAGSAPLYTGLLRGDGTGIYDPGWTSLGNVAAGQSGLIEVTITVPIELTNYFQNSLAAVEWEFYAQYNDQTPTPPPWDTPTPPPSPSPPVTTPPPEETVSPGPPPLVSPPIETGPPDGGTDPDYEVVVPPKTGDDQSVFTWVIAFAFALAGLVYILIYTVCKERQEKKEPGDA